jgi:hypothetical protein
MKSTTLLALFVCLGASTSEAKPRNENNACTVYIDYKGHVNIDRCIFNKSFAKGLIILGKAT